MNGIFRVLSAAALIALAGCGAEEAGTASCPGDCINLTPAAPTCDGNVAVSLGIVGTCVEGACQYPPSRRDCGDDAECIDGDCVEIIDLCAGVLCNDPPGRACDGTIARRYSSAGACEPETGTCVYDMSEEDCSLDGRNCEAGECVRPPDRCLGVVCDEPPEPACEDDVALVADIDGTCDPATGSCSYQINRTNCAANDQYCEDGVCVDIDPCDGVRCNTPPAATCDGTTIVAYARAGRCSNGDCTYTEQLTNCAADGNICEDATCVEPGPCYGVVCNTPPENRCAGEVAREYEAVGECSNGICSYEETVTNCLLDDLVCEDGSCVVAGPCHGVVCDVIPANVCRDNVAVSFRGPGECISGTCGFGEVETDCSETDEYCVGGFCDPVCPLPACNAPTPPVCDGDTLLTQRALNDNPCEGACTYMTDQVACSESGLQCRDGACIEIDPCEGVVCTRSPNVCDGDTAVRFTGPGECVLGDCDETGVRSETDCAALGRFCSNGACLPPAALLEGDELAISEFYMAPFTTSGEIAPDPGRQWIEIQNLYATELAVGGLVVFDRTAPSRSYALPDDAVIAPHGQLVIGASNRAAGGNVDYTWEGTTLTFAVAEGQLAIGNGVIELDRVDYTLDFDHTQYDAAQLDPAALYGNNNLPASWCAVFDEFDIGNTGTPGELNYPCDGRLTGTTLFISELMFAGVYTGAPAAEQWVEIAYRGAALSDISGVRLVIGADTFVIPLGTGVSSGQFLVAVPNRLFAANRSAWVFSALALVLPTGSIALQDGGFAPISRTQWNPSWTVLNNRSLQLKASALSRGASDDPNDYCSGSGTYPGPAVNYGTPRSGPDCGF